MSQSVAVLPAPGPSTPEGSPAPDRWRPNRAGLVALWRYWEETFTFHRGRLLLRGPNGSGKSMALELLLPFLLEADASPGKLSSAAKSRGGLFDRVMTGTDEQTRTGFAWVEFIRGREIVTVGARIRASQSTRKADVDFFTTTLAVGRELHLLDGNRNAVSRKVLVEAIGDTGRVHGSAEEHRAAVREILFSDFSADRYASVIGALLALRKEKLSQNLDLDKLSDVLSEALPPVDEHDIAAVAEGFERLDRRKAELGALETELGEVRQLAARQRDYARAVVVGTAGEVRSAETRRDTVTRDERRAGQDLDQAREEAQAATAEREALAGREQGIGVEIDALKDTDAYRDGAALADLRSQAMRLRQVAERAAQTARSRSSERAHAEAELERVEGEVSTATVNRERADQELGLAAEAAAANAIVTQAADGGDPDDAERLFRAWIGAQHNRIGDVRTALEAHERAVVERTIHEGQVADDEDAVVDRRNAHEGASAAVTSAIEAYCCSVEQWAGGCETLGPARVAAALPQSPDVPAAVRRAVADLTSAVKVEDAVARQHVGAERAACGAERALLDVERARWAEGGLPDPERPPWRSDRAGRPGAALWALVDTVPGMGGPEIDRLEAALTGSGLLDSWVQPEGSVELSPERADVVLTMRPVGGDTLGSLLVAALGIAEDTGSAVVPPEVVAGVLSSIPVVETALPLDANPVTEADVVIGKDGTYRQGSAVGRGPERPARLLGAPARERHRLVRLAELDTAIAAVDVRLADLAQQEAALDRRWSAVTAELAALPASMPVDDAERAVSDAAARLDEATSRLADTRAALRGAEDRVRAAVRDLTVLGARHGLPTDRDGLKAVELALSRLAEAVVTWGRRSRELAAAERDHGRSAELATRAGLEAVRAIEDHAASEREAGEVQGRVTALESSVGSEYAEVLDRMSALDRERGAGRNRERELAQRIPALERRVGELEAKLSAAAAARARADDDRESAQRRLLLAVDDLGADADIRPEVALDGSSAVLTFARAVAADHHATDADAATVERLSERVRERVHHAQATLGARVDIDRELAEAGWWVLRTMVGGLRRRARELTATLAGELEQGRAELAAEEEQLFEQTLAGSVRRALADRIRQANDLVDGINRQLGAIRTRAGGVQVRLRWEVDPDQLDAVKAARSLLLRDPGDLSEDERASLQSFVRARVDQARVELEANAPWEARLRETLDYRVWHRFTLQLGHRDWEGFQPATPRRLQKLSTGERSIALHLPMIASLAAHYAGPDGHASGCPRLILLDELFAGVDSANRAQLFGTFTAWDLDAVFTSDSEWCKYSTLDGIAIHHLHPPMGTDPVTSTRFTWDGRVQRIDPDPA